MLHARRFSMALVGLLFCVSTAEVSRAQGGGGRGGAGGRGQTTRTRFELATLPEVQADLKLTDEQKKLATEQLAKLREKQASMAPGGGGGGGGGGAAFQAARAEMAKMGTELDATFVAKLDDAQKTRMNGLIAQVNGSAALMDAAIAKELAITEEQSGKLKAANDANQTARREAMQGLQGKSPDEITTEIAKLTAEQTKALMGLLTEVQVKKLETIKGTALTMDMAPLRTPRRGQ